MKLRTFAIIVVVFFVILFLLIQNHLLLYSLYVRLCSKDELTPFVDLSHRKSVRELKKLYPQIRDEMLRSRHLFSQIEGDLFFESSITNDGKWKKIYLKWYSDPPSYAHELFPITTRYLNKHKDIHLGMFSLLEAGGKILPHKGLFRGCWRLHLTLVAPNSPDCFIHVGKQRYSWKEGDIVCFDDTNRHKVANNTDKERIVLFLDVERDMRLPFINRWVIKNICPSTTRKNEELEKKCARQMAT